MNFDKESYINYRINRADEALEEAVMLAKMKRWNSTINRLYYSCFYAVISLLIKKDLNPSTHQGAKTLFNFHYIKPEIISSDFGRLYSLLFDYRLKGDYGDMFDFTEEIVVPLLDKVPEFINEIKKHI